MINVTVIKTNNNIISIEATGHSYYAESGNDIICSAVSTLLESLINGLTEVIKIKANYNIDENIPHLFVGVDKTLERSKMRDAQILMQTTLIGIKSVAKEFSSKYIKIKEKQND